MVFLLVLLILGTYWSVTTHDFVDYDDGDYVTANPHVQAGLSWEGVKWAFTTGHASNWHPLTWLSHQLDVSLFGLKAGGHHLMSLLIHCANAVLVFLVLRMLTGAYWPSLFVAALFALHPLRVESVAWVSERKDVLSAFFGLWVLICYARYVRASMAQDSKSRMWYGLALAAFVIGLLCKPMLVTLPLLLLLLDYWPLGRASATAVGLSRVGNQPSPCTITLWRRLWIEKLPLLFCCLISSAITFLVQRKGGAVSPVEGLSISARIANAFVSYVRYLKKIFWPDDLSVLYPHPGHWPAWQVWAAVALILIISAAAFTLRRRMPFIFVGWFWFAGMLVPVIGLVQVGIQSMADRYTYLPSVGLLVALVWMPVHAVRSHARLRLLMAAAGCLIVAACVFATYFQVRIWRNSETLFGHAVQVTKNNYLAYNNLGFYFSKQGRRTEAMENFRASIRINPNYADAQNNLGHALAGERKFIEAMEHYRAGLRSSPENVEIHNNLGNALAELGDVDGAMAEYAVVLQRKPDHADAHNNLGIALAMKGRLPEAIEHFQQALKLKPGSAHGNLGNAFAAQRKWDAALKHYREALTYSPNDAQTHNNLGNVLAELGLLEEAVTNYTQALRLKAENPEAHFNLGYAFLRLNRREEAARHLREALRQRPDYTAARRQLEQLTGDGGDSAVPAP